MPMIKKPEWIKKRLFMNSREDEVKRLLKRSGINTVCKEAACPNIAECFSRKTATFLLLGNSCTRGCAFCNISQNKGPLLYDPDEPGRVAGAVKELGLKYVVLTSVTRDDIPDGGASIFADTVKLIKNIDKKIKVEVLVPDFLGNECSIMTVIDSGISVFNHNLETVKRLYGEIRPQADYQRSLNVLKFAKTYNKDIITKTGIMAGLGEDPQEVEALMKDFAGIGGDVMTIGQYLAPGKGFYPVKEYIKPELFKNYEEIGLKSGIYKIFSAPFVRSSYLSEKIFLD